MSLEQEAWKIEDVRRRAAGQGPPGPAAHRVERGVFGWIAALVLLGLLAGSGAILLGVALRVGVPPAAVLTAGSLAIAALIMALAASRDEARRLRQELRETQSILESLLAEDAPSS